MTSSIYVSLVEIRAIPGKPTELTDYGGAIVRLYLQAKSEESAISKIRESLFRNDFELVDVEWCVNEAEVEWENESSIGDSYIAEAKSTDEVVYSEFHVWD